MEAMKEATGIDMKEIVRANSIQAKTDRNINVTGLESLQPAPRPDPAPADAASTDPVTEQPLYNSNAPAPYGAGALLRYAAGKR